jgi:Ca2+:H+ antiporter
MYHKIGKIFLLMLIFIPLSWISAFFIDNKILTFGFAIISVIPLARIIGFATNELTLQTNPLWGGLINATFGNIIELVIAVMALSQGLIALVQASIIGSIIGNILLLTGLSIFFGGLKFKEQKFNKNSVGVSSTMLIISVVGLAIPTIFWYITSPSAHEVRILSDSVAIVLALAYISNLIFALITHKHLFDATDEIKATHEKPIISKKAAIILLCLTTIIVAAQSELVVSDIEFAADVVGVSQIFIGAVVIAIITNIAEKAAAVHFAFKNKIDVSLEIGMSSAIQIALFVVPILVFISGFFGYNFSLVFTLFEVVAMIFSVMIINYLSSDGICNWLEGVQLISVYLIIAIAFFFI